MSIHSKGKDRHGRPGWEIVIQYKLNGQQKRKACVLRGSKAEARTLEARMRADLEGQVAPTFSAVCEQSDDGKEVPCFDQFCTDDYSPNAQLHLKPSTWSKRSSQLATLIVFFRDARLDQISNARIDDFKRERRDAGLRNISINNELRVLRKLLTFARDERGINIVVPRIKFLPENERRPKIWTDTEVQQLFDACAKEAPALLPILVCLANTGMRRGEALALRWERVDLERRLIMIWPSDGDPDDDDDQGWEPKNRKPREVPISDALLPWLTGERASTTWVFPTRDGERYAYWPENQFQRVQRRAGLKGGVHTLRHTYASYFLQTKTLAALAGVLGHSHTRVTELYAHLLPSHLEDARNAVMFAPSTGPAVVAAKRRWRKADVISGDESGESGQRPRRNVR